MNSGKIIEDEFGSFAHEVLNAEWQPPLPELQPGAQVRGRDTPASGGLDAEAFLNGVYLSQE